MNKDSLAGFLVGIGAGVAVGLLCAPRSGADMRRVIAGSAKDHADSVKQQASDLWNSTNEVLEQTKATVSKAHTGLMNAAEAGRKAYQEAAS